MNCRPLIALLAAVCSFVAALAPPARGADAPARPNILWLTTEDTGPQLGCYGDAYADTPNLDRFAGRSLLYQNAWSNAPVCAPARTGIISGVYPTATGSEHMRSMVPMPAFMRMYPQVMREAGYYCTNNAKEDYNLAKAGKVWDESSGRAHYKNRQPGQPFLAVFNHTGTHESQIRKRPHTAVHDPAKAPLPAYHPDAPEVRQDWAQYYDNITTMDGWFGDQLKELADAGLADDTVVFFYGDHGSGMPRSKRWPYNSGLHVPLIVHVPQKWKHLAPPEYAAGGKTDRLVSFVDLAPTLFSLAGVKPPEWVQGRAFAGAHAAPPREYVFGFRGRMDERTDSVRSVRDKRYVYVRNFMPHRIYGQHLNYMFQTPATRVWKKMFDDGKLQGPQAIFWGAKPAEELYDLQADKDEVRNLAGSAEHREVLERMRAALRGWMLETRDVGLLPEGEIHARAKGSTPYEMGQDKAKYDLPRVLEVAELASNGQAGAAGEMTNRLSDSDPAVRYWAATGLLARGSAAVGPARDKLAAALKDESPFVRIVAAEALGRFGSADDAKAALDVLIDLADVKRNGVYVAMPALAAVDALGEKAAPAKDRIAALPTAEPASTDPRMREYVPRLLEHVGETLGFEMRQTGGDAEGGKKAKGGKRAKQ